MEYTIEEIQTMLNIVSAVVANSHIEQLLETFRIKHLRRC